MYACANISHTELAAAAGSWFFLSFSLYISLYSLMHFLSLYSNAKAEILNFCNSSRRQLVCNLFPTITRARISYPGSRPVRAGRGHQLPVLGSKTSCSERNLKLWRVYVCVCVFGVLFHDWGDRAPVYGSPSFTYWVTGESDCSSSCIADSLRNETGLICCFTLLSRYMHMLAGRVRRASSVRGGHAGRIQLETAVTIILVFYLNTL